ncbi:hypothetical protein [Gelidibacter salicanalis]|nr:hypothetical protein [Gelidibacter salicanalis]
MRKWADPEDVIIKNVIKTSIENLQFLRMKKPVMESVASST